jgi:hypothetical protein
VPKGRVGGSGIHTSVYASLKKTPQQTPQ